jgi:hypothetical protein
MEPFVEFLGTLRLSQLPEVYREIPIIARRELFKWIKSDNSEEIDERYIYVSQKHLDSIALLTPHAVACHSNYVALWLLRFFDPDRIVEDDFLDPTLFNTVRLSLIIFALAPSPPILGGSELKVPQFWGI